MHGQEKVCRPQLGDRGNDTITKPSGDSAPIPRAFQVLADRLDYLEARLGTMENRFTPVLAPPSPVETSRGISEGFSAFETHINRVIFQVEHLTSVVNDVIERNQL